MSFSPLFKTLICGIIFLFSVPAFPARTSILTPDLLIQQKRECLQSSFTKSKIISSRDLLIDQLSQEFCDRPHHFCNTLNNFVRLGEKSLFFGPKCEPGSFPRDILDNIG